MTSLYPCQAVRPPDKPSTLLLARYTVLAVCAIWGAACASGPFPGPMVTDRPDFTESTATVAPGHAQLEAGYTMAAANGIVAHDVGESLIRAGLTERIELRVGVGSWRVVDPETGGTTTGFDGSSLGLKFRLPATGLAQSAAVLVGTTVPLGTDFGDPGWTPSLVLAGSWGGSAVNLGANLGYAHTETTDGTGELLTSLAAGFPVSSAVGAFIEVYGIAPRGGRFQASVDGGFTVGLTHDVQLDVRLGRTVSGPAETVVGVGLAVRR